MRYINGGRGVQTKSTIKRVPRTPSSFQIKKNSRAANNIPYNGKVNNNPKTLEDSSMDSTL